MKNLHALLVAAGLASASRLPAKQQGSGLVGVRDLTSWGGWGILTTNCPSGTKACDSQSCCPNGYKCIAGVLNPVNICCPGEDDCSSTVKVLDACADTSWSMYNFGGYFCCPPGSVGTYKADVGRQCVANDLPIPTSIALTTISQVSGTGTAAATNPASSGAGSGSGSSSGSGTGSSSSSGSGSGSVTRSQSSPTGSSSGPTSDPASSNNSTTNSGSNSGLPQSAIIAIAVLSTMVGMLLIFVPWILCWRRNKTNSSPPAPAPASAPLRPPAAPHGPQELHHQHQYPPAPAIYAPAAVPPAHHDISPSIAPTAPPTYTTPPPNMSELHNTPYTAPVYETDAVQRNELAAQPGK